MLEVKCRFPECKKEEKHFTSVALPVIQEMESGELELKESIKIPVPFCKLHSFIAMRGILALIQKDDKFQWESGTITVIGIVEAVIGAFVASGELQKQTDSWAKAGKNV